MMCKKQNKGFCVYLHTNKINQKKYIGQTVHGDNPNLRWQNGKGYQNCTYFYRAIQKYGWDNFDHEILENNLTSSEANRKEEYYISLYNTLDPEYGYNICSGGDNHKISSVAKSKLKKYNIGSNSPKAKMVQCLETKEVFGSISDAAKELEVPNSSLQEVLKGARESIKGTHWIFFKGQTEDVLSIANGNLKNESRTYKFVRDYIDKEFNEFILRYNEYKKQKK